MQENHSEILLTTGGAGHTSAAASRSKANRSALNSQKTPYGKSIIISKSDIELKFIQPSTEELKKVKNQINTDEKNNRKKELLIFVVALLILTSLIFLFF